MRISGIEPSSVILLRCKDYFKSDFINNMDHMRKEA